MQWSPSRPRSSLMQWDGGGSKVIWISSWQSTCSKWPPTSITPSCSRATGIFGGSSKPCNVRVSGGRWFRRSARHTHHTQQKKEETRTPGRDARGGGGVFLPPGGPPPPFFFFPPPPFCSF